jgi:HK97 family phage prohead protease
MRTTTQDTEFIFEQREDVNGDIVGTGTGRAVPYGVEIEIGGVRESFARDAFNVDEVIGKPLAYRHNEPVGIITGAENREDGLYIDFDIVNTTLGRDAATLARTGASRGLSVGFNPIKSAWTKTRDAVQHMSAGLQEVSLTPYPAYATAGVSAIREDEGVPMSETIVETEVVSVDTEAREAIANVRESLAGIEARAFTATAVHPLAAYRTFGEYSKAVLAGEVESRALADQITANNDGVLPPNWMMDVKRIVDLGRPAITAMGVESAGVTGLEFAWPYFDGDLATIVAEQETEKTEVNSVRIDIEKGTATLDTYAAGSDISYQLLQRSSPSYLDAHNRIMANSYSFITNKAFADALEARVCAGSDLPYNIAGDTDGLDFREYVFEASVLVETETGLPATVVLVGSSLFRKFGGWSSFNPATYSVQNVSGVATASTLAVNVSGLPVVHVRTLPANRAIISNTTTASWIEDGPQLATAENVANLGRDIAIYGYGTTAIYNPCGIVRL